MKTRLLLLSILLPALAQAQEVEMPGNPLVKGQPARKTGSGTGRRLEPGSEQAGVVKYVTHVILAPPRIWTNAGGKTVQAALIAFEDLTATAAKGAAAPIMPAPPSKPTVVKDGRVRLLVERKPTETPLASLSEGDRTFVEGLQAAIAKKAAE